MMCRRSVERMLVRNLQSKEKSYYIIADWMLTPCVQDFRRSWAQ